MANKQGNDMSQCCGFGKCTGAPDCVQRRYYPSPKQEPNYPLKGDAFGWFLIVSLSLLVLVPFAAIAEAFGDTAGPYIFLILAFGFPAWAIHQGTKPYS